MFGSRRLATYISTFTGLAVLVMSPSVLAAAGDLDRQFGGDGRVTTDLDSLNEGALAVAIQPDGKIVVVGITGDPNLVTSGVLVRYDATGTLDPTFDGDGIRFFDGLNPADIVVQPDGKIVVAGTAKGPDFFEDFAVARFNTDGTANTSFGSEGIATAGSPSGNGRGRAIALQPDGRIVVVGWTDQESEGGDAAIARFNSDGTLDTSFGNAIRVLNMGAHSYANAVSIQTNGKIVVAGEGAGAKGWHFALARLHIDGTGDTSFGGDGRVRTVFGDGSRPSDVVVLADGRIMVAGTMFPISKATSDFALARYTSRGTLDATFSHDGRKRSDFSSGNDEAHSLMLQSNGRIVLAGSAAPPRHRFNASFGLARYTVNGKLDPTFSGDGKKRTRFGSNYRDFGNDAALQPNGRIVVAGSVTRLTTESDFGLARYLAE
jgi:uncharacterized delta-60 repeat protein